MARAEPHVAAELTPERLAARHAEAQAGVDRLREAVRRAELDALIVVGDDHKELYRDDNLPSFVVYYGETIRNVPLNGFSGPDWARRATARYYEEKEPRDYPVESRLALHLITSLVDREFDPVSSDALPEGKGEGHAFAFVRKRLMEDASLPVVPIFLNTYFPPNQPTPRRCYKLGQAIREAVESYPGDARVGIVGSGGLSHFVVDEELDRGLLDACAAQGRRGAAIRAAAQAQFRQLGDPHVDLRRRRRRASRCRLVELCPGLPDAGRLRHRARLRPLVVRSAR